MSYLSTTTNPSIQVAAPARLHFGLMEINPCQPNCFGGLGVMLDEPAMILKATLAEEWQTNSVDPWGERIQAAAGRWQERTNLTELPPLNVSVVQAPVPHTGLGTGTQLACSVVAILEAWQQIAPMALMNNANGKRDPVSVNELMLDSIAAIPSIAELTKKTGRGQRSCVGLHGFLHGGWVVDLGGTAEGVCLQQVETRHVLRFTAQAAWRVILVTPAMEPGASGEREAELFRRCQGVPNRNREAMIRLIHSSILPGLESGDLDICADAIHDYGRWAGEVFASVQNGPYRGATVSETVIQLRNWGARAVGQSSWGPTVFAIVASQLEAESIVGRFERQSAIPLPHIRIVGLAQQGATVCIGS